MVAVSAPIPPTTTTVGYGPVPRWAVARCREAALRPLSVTFTVMFVFGTVPCHSPAWRACAVDVALREVLDLGAVAPALEGLAHVRQCRPVSGKDPEAGSWPAATSNRGPGSRPPRPRPARRPRGRRQPPGPGCFSPPPRSLRRARVPSPPAPRSPIGSVDGPISWSLKAPLRTDNRLHRYLSIAISGKFRPGQRKMSTLFRRIDRMGLVAHRRGLATQPADPGRRADGSAHRGERRPAPGARHVNIDQSR